MQDIRSLVKGTSGYPYKVVLDGMSATSTVRFVMDSLLQGAAMGKNISAAMNREEVIDYISNNTDAVGLAKVVFSKVAPLRRDIVLPPVPSSVKIAALGPGGNSKMMLVAVPVFEIGSSPVYVTVPTFDIAMLPSFAFV